MSYDKPVAAAGKAAVGDQCDFISESLSHDCTRRAEHLAHTRRTFGTFVADNNDIAGDDSAIQNRLQRGLLRVEHARAARERQAFFSSDFRHRAFRREIAVEDYQMAVLLDRTSERLNDS